MGEQLRDEPYLILQLHGASWDALWWGPNNRGYTVDVSKAGRYTRREAEEQAASRSSDRAVPESLALSMARPTVDRDSLLAKMAQEATHD